MITMLTSSTPAAGLSSCVAAEQSAYTAPVTRGKGTGVPFAGPSAQVALGARSTDLLGRRPRGAPV